MATQGNQKSKRRVTEEEEEDEVVYSKKLGVRQSLLGQIDKTKEYAIYWLSNDPEPSENYHQTWRLRLRGIIDYLYRISDIDELTKANDCNIFVVIEFRCFVKHELTLTSHDQIRAIYVYDFNKNDQFVDVCSQNGKIHGPFKTLEDVFFDLSRYIRTMVWQSDTTYTEQPPLKSASKTVERSTSSAYSYVTDWYVYLIRALEEVPPTETCKQLFVDECRILYQDNASILKAIDEFEKTYRAEDAIHWYTKDGFLYKTMNRVLREQNQQAIALLHFLIYDLNQQITKELRTTEQEWMRADTVRLYRGQLMSIEELEQLRKNKGEELFVNSFLSMTTDIEVAKIFSGAGTFDADSPIQSVIFEVEWGDFSPKQGLADIHRLSFNHDENEILFSPTYTISLLDCVYDQTEQVWYAKFCRIAHTDNPLIRIHDDERLMRLELTLRHLIDQKHSADNEIEDLSGELSDDRFTFTPKFCSTFADDMTILQHELELPDLCSVTLNDEHLDRFQLKTIQSFIVDALEHGPRIEDSMVVTLYDALGRIFHLKGKLMQAYYYYQKASMYDDSQSQTSYTRQAYLAQIHKINGDYELAWKIFDELMNRTEDTDNFLYEDIVFARSNNMTEEEYLKTSRAFLEYSSRYGDNDCQDESDDENEDERFVYERIGHITGAWAELGYRYFYQLGDDSQALECFTRERELSNHHSPAEPLNPNPLVGSYAERMGDIYAFRNELEKALPLYQEALDLSMKATFIVNVMATARCMCKIGWCRPQHDPSIFRDAFQYLLQGYGKFYLRDTVGKCYMYLSRSLERCQRYETALKYAQQAFTVFSRDPLMLERLVDRCYEWIVSLQRSNGTCVNDGGWVGTTPPKDHVALNDEEIKRMLEITLSELETESE